MSALSTHHKRTKIETKTVKNKEARENLNKWQKLERSKNKSLDQAKIDSLRQGNGSTQSIKHKHDSSKTEAELDTVMPEAKRKLGAKQSRNSHWNAFPPYQCNSHHMHNKFLKLSKIKHLSPCSITKLLPLVGTCTHQGSTDLKLPLKLRLPLNICYAMNAMQEV